MLLIFLLSLLTICSTLSFNFYYNSRFSFLYSITYVHLSCYCHHFRCRCRRLRYLFTLLHPPSPNPSRPFSISLTFISSVHLLTHLQYVSFHYNQIISNFTFLSHRLFVRLLFCLFVSVSFYICICSCVCFFFSFSFLRVRVQRECKY